MDDSAWLSSNESSIDFAEKADNETRQMWCQGIPDQDGWFTLTWPPTHEILTCSEDGELTLAGKIFYSNACYLIRSNLNSRQMIPKF